MNNQAEVRDRIIQDTVAGLQNSEKSKRIAERIKSGKATYADALDYAQECSRVMKKA